MINSWERLLSLYLICERGVVCSVNFCPFGFHTLVFTLYLLASAPSGSTIFVCTLTFANSFVAVGVVI